MTGVVPVVPRFKFFDASGNPLALGSVTVYLAGTTTLADTYQDRALTTLNTNPVTLDANGECLFWTSDANDYKFLLKNAAGATVTGWPVDNIPGSGAGSFLQSGTGAVRRSVQSKLDEIVLVTDFMSTAQRADILISSPLVDQSAAIQAAIDSGAKRILFPKGNFRVDNTVTLKDGVYLVGASSGQAVGTRIHFTKNDGTHCFTSAQNNFLSFCRVENFEIYNSVNAPGNVASGDAFHLFGVTNNCGFKNIFIRNFGGHGFFCGQQTLNPADKTAAQNCIFEGVFITSCGGYAFYMDGYVNASWVMCDLNSCATGFVRFNDGTTNQTQANFYGLWVEGTQAYSALTVFDMQATNGQMLNLIGCNIINGVAGTSRIVKSTTSSCRLNVIGLTGFGWTYLHEDTPAGITDTLSAPTNLLHMLLTKQATIQGASPLLDLYQMTGGTTDQRRFRLAFLANKLLMTARNDDGTSARSLVTWNHNTGEYAPAVDDDYNNGSASTRWANTYSTNFRPGAGGALWTSGSGDPEGAVTGSIGSLYTRTDGGAITTLYVKESGSGTTGWVAK
jgi:hypothetical protein